MINDNITITSLHKGNITPDALVDEIRRLMAERNKAIVELDAARAELAEAQGNFEHLKEHFHALFADGGIRLESMAADRDAARAELAAQSKLLDAEIAELRENLKIAHEALTRISEHPCVLEAHALSGIAAAALIGMGAEVVDRATGKPFSHVNVSGWANPKKSHPAVNGCMHCGAIVAGVFFDEHVKNCKGEP